MSVLVNKECVVKYRLTSHFLDFCQYLLYIRTNTEPQSRKFSILSDRNFC